MTASAVLPAAGSATGDLTGVAAWAVQLMETLGSPGVGFVVALENVFPPIPSEVILPLAGFTASRGSFNLIEAIGWATVGSLVGALVLYGLGAWFGRDRMRAIVGRIPLVKLSDVDRTEAWFQRHGTKAVFFGRMIPLFRSLISIPAGIERMPLVRFSLLTTAGSLVWNTIFVLAGFLLGENWSVVESYAGVFQYVVIAGCAAVALVLVARGIRRFQRDRAAR